MAPIKGPHEPPLEEEPSEADKEEFFKKLKELHEQRGTNLDSSARVNGKHIDLFRLFRLVVSRGGYDAVSAEKLAWRSVGQAFNVGATNAAAYAFALKTVYYKNLVAYEIKTVYNKEPPPKEILENLTAKGADVVNRTLENFTTPRRLDSVANGHDSESSEEEEETTPKEEKMDIEEPGSGAGRTRGLRQAPPQRQIFQPDISSSRQTRHMSNNANSPQPPNSVAATGHGYGASNHSTSLPYSIANYEPRPPVPLTLRPVITPGNNPILFKQKQGLATAKDNTRNNGGFMKPGAGFDGPNIYVRALCGLRSGIPAEEDYALHHLVKISHERGDKYRFEAFPGLADGLIAKVLQIGSVFYNVQWEISYDEDNTKIHLLDGVNGTKDILDRLVYLRQWDISDEIETAEFRHQVSKIHEAGLTIRNMALLEDNAQYLSEMPSLRDLLSIILSLPNSHTIEELKQYALDIAEEVTKYWSFEANDPLYILLLKQLESSDRGTILTSLRAICRISMNLDVSNSLKGVSIEILRSLSNYLLLDDEEFVAACLDFLYQYTATAENVAFLLTHNLDLPLAPLLTQLSRLLLHRAQTVITKRELTREVPVPAATEIPDVPPDLLETFLRCDEPQRSILWLKSCFEEDLDSDLTQIRLWQAYQARFTEHATLQQPLLPAAEFIKNVSATFAGANAQVVNGNGVAPKYTIRGIRPRHVPVDVKGRTYTRCLWKEPGEADFCGQYFLRPTAMWEHVVVSHIGIPMLETGKFDMSYASGATSNRPQISDCYWASCHHFARQGGAKLPYDVGMHFKTHLPDSSQKAILKQLKQQKAPADNPLTDSVNRKRKIEDEFTPVTHVKPATFVYHTWRNTATDERGNPAGLPLTSVLILRNIARNIPKAAPLLEGGTRVKGEETWMEELFGSIRKQLAYAMAYNRSLGGYVADLMGFVDRGMHA